MEKAAPQRFLHIQKSESLFEARGSNSFPDIRNLRLTKPHSAKEYAIIFDLCIILKHFNVEVLCKFLS